MRDWQEIKLKDISELITKGTTPSTIGGGFQAAGINFIKSESLSYDGQIDKTKFAKISDETHQQLKRSQIKENDILYSIAGINLGKCGLAKSEYLPANTNQAVAIIRVNNKIADPKFVHFYLRNSAFVIQVNSGTAQSAQPNVNLADIGNFNLKIPDIAEQKAIAAVLGVLDDKIELNRKMNATLEAMARALFKSWFVDFDPVRAKMEGKQPFGMDVDTAALFPSRLVPSPLGDIPEGWEVKPLDKIAKFLNGLALQKYPATAEKYLPVIKISQIRQGNSASADKASIDIPPEYVIEDGDVIFSWSGSLMQVLWTGGKGALNQHLFKVTSDNYPKWLYFLWVEAHMPWFQGIAASKATTMGHIQRIHLEQAQTVIPPTALINKMNEVFSPIFKKRLEIGIENKQLTNLRDYLLPKLISGDIRIPDADKFVEAA